MDPIVLLRNIRQRIAKFDWQKTDFDWEKAYVCSVLSTISYAFIPQFEIDRGGRFQLVPCNLYQLIYSLGMTLTTEYLRGLDFDDPFVIPGQYFIIFGLKVGKLLFIAVRGTAAVYKLEALNDWRINLNVRTVLLDRGIRFHRGFYMETKNFIDQLATEIDKRNAARSTIYLAGHSLGGGVAAVLCAYWQEFFGDSPLASNAPNSCYTFGMPRYGNLQAVQYLRSPYHIYNGRDIVPKLPAEGFGYVNSAHEHRLDEERPGVPLEKIRFPAIQWLLGTVTAKPIRDHLIENYRRILCKKLKIDESAYR